MFVPINKVTGKVCRLLQNAKKNLTEEEPYLSLVSEITK